MPNGLKRLLVFAILISPIAIWGWHALTYRLFCALDETREMCAVQPTDFTAWPFWQLAILPWGGLLVAKIIQRRSNRTEISVNAGDVFDRLKR